MGFHLKKDQTVSSEIRRIVLKQLDLATSELKTIGDPESNEAVHVARRRVKKIRAIMRLVRPVLGKAFRAIDPDLRRVSRLLAPVGDGREVITTLNQLARRYQKVLPRKVMSVLHSDLVDRERRIDLRAEAEHVLQRASNTLRSHRSEVKRWQLSSDGFRALAPGLKESIKRARKAMLIAWKNPTAAHHHSWRRSVKDHWFHVRLLETRCGNHLMAVQRQLEALDGILGEYHNLVLLHELLTNDSVLSRQDVAQCLRVVAKYQRILRRHAQTLGMRIYEEKPRAFVRRVKRFWQETARETAARPSRVAGLTRSAARASGPRPFRSTPPDGPAGRRAPGRPSHRN